MPKFFGIFDNKIPGKGLTKEEAEYKGLKGFFTIFKEKIWKMAQMNLIYMLFCLPLFVVFYLGSQFIVPGGTAPIAQSSADYAFIASWNGINVGTSYMLSYSQFWTDLVIRIGLFVLLVSIPVLAIGPLQAGFSYNMFSFVRGKPVFLMTDFFGKAKDNFKQSIIVSFIDLIIIVVAAIDFKLYFSSFISGSGGFLAALATTLMMVIILIYVIMHMYIYPLMVTFKMNLKQLFKNSFYFAMISFLPALGILILNFLIVYVLFNIFTNPLLHILFSLVVIPSVLALINSYFIYPYVKKYLLDPALQELENEKGEEEETIFKD